MSNSSVRTTTTTATSTITSLLVNDSVKTDHVRLVVDTAMFIIIIVIILFLISHFFIRLHYKAKTEHALAELREKHDKNSSRASPFAVSKGGEQKKAIMPPNANPQSTKTAPNQNVIVLNSEQLAPILHQISLGNPPRIEAPNQFLGFAAAP